MTLQLRPVLWLGFFAVILGAWWVMFAMARGAGLDVLGRPGAMHGMGMAPMTGFATLAGMWAVMMAAMMLPTLVPTLRSYEDLMVSADATRAGWLGVILGYLAVWIGAALLFAGAQVALLAAGAVDALGPATSVWIAAGLLFGVGLYQFSHLKQMCHTVCQAPMMYFLGHWRTGFGGGLRMGVPLGFYCVGCCWGYMALGFVGGVMNLAWMGLATVVMVIEKLPQIGAFVTRPMGVALMMAAVGLIAARAAAWI